ncbi:hypothetical protein VFPPC_17672 [Pochonia chlamydosporia 170]|uniref:Uncharacterized protein n=1 Tax=Pochonia chlamydosporia 170 TaxID=1380566 RepID=A0A219ARC5_METCM|nr:hypothetical protein VFPPC_17672 [Pochonia chlamydosporia 170]OWT43152.1 hypothetical protein VFPPC_17672 [Pochonia chlamydosporia 170]
MEYAKRKLNQPTLPSAVKSRPRHQLTSPIFKADTRGPSFLLCLAPASVVN